MVKRAIAGVIVGLALGTGMEARAIANKYVSVTCGAPETAVLVDPANSKDFIVYAPGCLDAFTANVKVTCLSGWRFFSPEDTTKPLTFEMQGGDVQKYGVRALEDSGAGDIYFHNYFISTNETLIAKDIIVPVGISATYIAHGNKTGRKSDWTVEAHGETASKKGATQIVFNRDGFEVEAWYFPNVSTPKPGAYSINAKDVSERRRRGLADSGTMKVVGADFVSAFPGFDDYTNWSLGTADYYKKKDERKGRCDLPYSSVEIAAQGSSLLKITPGDVTLDIVSSVLEANMAFAPKTASGSTEITFTPASGWVSLGEATLTAQYEETDIAKLQVVPFKKQTRSVLVVYVGAVVGTVGLGSLNDAFKQCITEFQQPLPAENFSYTDAPADGKWSNQDHRDLLQVVLQDTSFQNKIATSDHVVFVLPGSDATDIEPDPNDPNSKGQKRLGVGDLGEQNVAGKYVWIYAHVTCPYVLAHEFGHNLGLDDLYSKDANGHGVAGAVDKDNLMNWCTCNEENSNPHARLRYGQWKTIIRKP